MILQRLPLVLAFALLSGAVFPCEPSAALQGVESIPECDGTQGDSDCISGNSAIFDALKALDIAGAYTVGVQTSPWRMYDGEGRIMTVEDAAAAIRPGLADKHRRVYLVGSWTATRPDGDEATLAKRLSDALDGYPVDGSDGFLWLSPAGDMRTTRQAFTAWKTGPYSVRRGDDVLMALVPGSLAQFEDRFAEDGIAEGVVQAGIGHDVFMLCPESALAAFERAADMGNAIGAYNAGLMHAEQGQDDAAITWLERAAALGEAKATTVLAKLRGAD